MDDRASRVFMGLCVLVLMWIGVYWLWQPGSPSLTFAARDSRQSVHSNAKGQLPADATPTPPGGVEPPQFREYVVQSDDTFERIADRELGDAALWTVVARANPLKDPRRLKAGQVLRLPLDVTNVQGRVAPPPEPTLTEVAVSNPDPAVKTYVVRPGDTLSEIAKAHYGATTYARFIYEANTDTLRDIDSLRAGQTLRLPPPPNHD
ncbi:MAG: LysM peptidoglycan-binding domain-containing protein [Phycisphaerales bacterium]